MGKVLIIRGADFSNSAIEIIENFEKIQLTEDNAFQIETANITSTDVWVQGSNTYICHKIKKGQLVVCPTLDKTPQGVMFTFLSRQPITFGNSIDNITPLSAAPLIMYRNSKYNNHYGLYATEDCYFIRTNYEVPEPVYVIDYKDNEVLDENNYDWTYENRYINNTGGYGGAGRDSYDDKLSFCCYSVFAGDEITIESNSEKYTSYKLLKKERAAKESITILSQDKVLREESKTIQITEDCYLYILRYDAADYHFPKSIIRKRGEQ